MGPVSRYLGPSIPEPQLWQDPVPAVDHKLVDDKDIAALKAKVLGSGLSVSDLVSTAWSSAASFRSTDKRGGANGAGFALSRRRIGRPTSPPSSPRCSRFSRRSSRIQRRGRREDLAG